MSNLETLRARLYHIQEDRRAKEVQKAELQSKIDALVDLRIRIVANAVQDYLTKMKIEEIEADVLADKMCPALGVTRHDLMRAIKVLKDDRVLRYSYRLGGEVTAGEVEG